MELFSATTCNFLVVVAVLLFSCPILIRFGLFRKLPSALLSLRSTSSYTVFLFGDFVADADAVGCSDDDETFLVLCF